MADIKETEISPQEFTRQLDLAFIDELTGKFASARTVADFILAVEDEFASYTDGDTRDAVRLSTYHLAKGLEWQAVFLPALNDGELPYWRSKDDHEIARSAASSTSGLPAPIELSTHGSKRPSRFLAEVQPVPAKKPGRRQRGRARNSGSSTTHTPLKPKMGPNSFDPFKK